MNQIQTATEFAAPFIKNVGEGVRVRPIYYMFGPYREPGSLLTAMKNDGVRPRNTPSLTLLN